MKAETTFSLKDQLFNQQKVSYLADLFKTASADFKVDKFTQEVVEKFPELELKQRIEHICTTLETHLPANYLDALEIIERALPPELDPDKVDDDFGDFIIAPLSHFVASNGCTEESLHRSLDALKSITKRFSAEDAIRYFINRFPEQTLDFLEQCSRDDNYHVRRLASEGTRPKLPWCQKITIDYQVPIPILENLFSDPSRYVTRSVANHLNDISKLDPDLVITCLRRWQKSNKQTDKEMDFIVKHSLRTLIKQGHPEALKLLGFGEKPAIIINRFESKVSELKVGETFVFDLEFTTNKKQNLMIDYVMHFRADNNKTSTKVFKLKQLTVNPGENISLSKKHPMRLMTTRRLYPGKHIIQLQVNGTSLNKLSFNLVG